MRRRRAGDGRLRTGDHRPGGRPGGDTVGISVDPIVAEGGWSLQIGGQALASDLTDAYYRFTFPEQVATDGPGYTLQVIAAGQAQRGARLLVLPTRPPLRPLACTRGTLPRTPGLLWRVAVPTHTQEFTVPTGKVKWYDAEKGFGFLSDEGEDVYVRANSLPTA